MKEFLRAVRLAMVFVVSVPCIARADAPPNAPLSVAPSAALYARLVEKARNGDADTDYTALRLSYVQTDDYDPYSTRTHDLYKGTWAALEAKDCGGALAKSNELLKIDFTRIVIHAMRSDCFNRMGDATSAARELSIGRGLAASLLSSGDGKSPSTAFVVVTLNEEGFVLNELGVTQKIQGLVNENGHEYDLIHGIDGSGHEVSVYFEVSNLFAGLSRQMGSRGN